MFVSYAGLTKVTAIAGEVRNPGKTLPRAIIISLALIPPLYCLLVFTLNGVLGVDQLQTNIHPIYSLAQATIGPTGLCPWALSRALVLGGVQPALC